MSQGQQGDLIFSWLSVLFKYNDLSRRAAWLEMRKQLFPAASSFICVHVLGDLKQCGWMPLCHADKATEMLSALLLKASRPVEWDRHCGVARTWDQGSKPGGYTWVDTVSLMLLMDCPTGALADWQQAQRSSTD